MSEIEYTDAELREFDNLQRRTESRDQLTRIEGRLSLNDFVKRHGQPKCEAMWSKILADEKARRRKA